LKDRPENRFIKLWRDRTRLAGNRCSQINRQGNGGVFGGRDSGGDPGNNFGDKDKDETVRFFNSGFFNFFHEFHFAAVSKKRTAGSGGIRGAAAYTASDG